MKTYVTSSRRVASALFAKTKYQSQRLKAELAHWIHTAAHWTVAATLTFKRAINGQAFNHEILHSSLRHYLLLVDRKFFTRSETKHNKFVESVVVIGYGPFQSNPHAHIAVAAPDGIDYTLLVRELNHTADKTIWINRERDFQPYSDSGWSEYMVDHDPENLILPLFRSYQYSQVNHS